VRNYFYRRSILIRSGWLFIAITLALLANPPRAFAANCQWKTDAATSTWTDANNWTNCNSGVPGSSDSAQIQTGGTQPIITTAVTLAGLTIDVSATLTIGSGGSLTLTSNFSNSGTYTYSSGAGTTIFDGTTTLSGNGTWTFRAITINANKTLNAGATAITLAGTFTINGTFNGDSGSVTFTLAAVGSGGTVGGSGTSNFNHLTVNVSGSKTLSVSSGKTISVAGDFTKTAGTFACGGGVCTLNFNGSGSNNIATTNTNHDFNFSIASGKTIMTASTFKLSGDLGGSGTFTANAGTITFNGTTTQTISATTTFNHLTINSGAIVALATKPLVNGTVTNNGLLRETQTVNGSSDVDFICLGTTSANCSAYKGITLNANNSDLGSTTIDVMGNSLCGGVTGTVKRCYDLRPTNTSGRNATATFYFLSGELNNENCTTLNAWRYTGSTFASTGTTGTRQCTTDPYSTQVTGIANFSVFALKTTSPSVPTPITIASIEAESGGADWTLAAFGLGALIFGATAWVARSRHHPRFARNVR
jgi:hypothetical protein